MMRAAFEGRQNSYPKIIGATPPVERAENAYDCRLRKRLSADSRGGAGGHSDMAAEE